MAYFYKYANLYPLASTATYRNLTLVNDSKKANTRDKALVPAKKYVQVKPNKAVRAELTIPRRHDKVEQPQLIRTNPNSIIRPELLKEATATTKDTDILQKPQFLQPKPNKMVRLEFLKQVIKKKRAISVVQDRKHSSTPTKSRIVNKSCVYFVKYGRCKDSSKCAYKHDAAHVGVCKVWLRGGNCSASNKCYLQHNPSPNVVPHCRHFQHGLCFKEECRYTHVHVAKNAPLCRQFVEEGYCVKGNMCKEKHEWRSKADLEMELKANITSKRSRSNEEMESGHARKLKLESDHSSSDIWDKEFISLRDI